MGDNKRDFLSGARGPGGGQGELAKATITGLGVYLGKDPSKRGGVSEDEPITVMFNPKEFTLEKSVAWKFHETAGTENELIEYTGSDGESLSFTLFADTSRQGRDVRAYTEQIRALTYPDEELGHPRVIRFDWGTFTFKGFITKLTQKFTHHLPTGVPVRATLDVTIKELDLKPRDPSEPDPDDDTETSTEAAMRGRGGGGTENGTEGGRDVDHNSTSGGNESMGEPNTEGEGDEGETEPGTEGDNGQNNDGPWIKLKHIWPAGGVVNGDVHWNCYHHSACYIEMHVFGVKKVKLSMTPYGGKSYSMYITGFWKQEAPGKAGPKDGVFDIGGVGQTSPKEGQHESRGKCYFLNEYGTKYGAKGHPSKHLVGIGLRTVNGHTTTEGLSHDKYVIALQPRDNGSITLEAMGIGPYDVPAKAGEPEDPKTNIVIKVINFPRGD